MATLPANHRIAYSASHEAETLPLDPNDANLNHRLMCFRRSSRSGRSPTRNLRVHAMATTTLFLFSLRAHRRRKRAHILSGNRLMQTGGAGQDEGDLTMCLVDSAALHPSYQNRSVHAVT